MRVSIKLPVLSVALVLALTACGPRETAPAPAAPADATAAVPTPTPAPVAAVAAGKNDPAVINFAGFGPATFGTDEEHVRQAWGRPLVAGTPAEGSSCYLLTMDPAPEPGKGIRFLFEDGGFARYEINDAQFAAPGDIVVGAQASDVMTKFAGRITEQPAKYLEGAKTLIVTPEDGGDARLMFDVDPAGIVTAWRIGMPPQIYYVEGCG